MKYFQLVFHFLIYVWQLFEDTLKNPQNAMNMSTHFYLYEIYHILRKTAFLQKCIVGNPRVILIDSLFITRGSTL